MQPRNAETMAVSGVQLIRSTRRTLSLEVDENLELRVRAPRWITEREIVQFVRSRQLWIDKARYEVRRRKALLQEGMEGGLYWEGQVRPLFSSAEMGTRFGFFKDRFLIHPLWINEFEKTAEAWFREQAAVILQRRLQELSAHTGIHYQSFRLGRSRGRWGSCSHTGAITLHWRLVWVPAWIRDYVILHELSHRRHFDHSRSFWRDVAGFFPDYREACGWLKDRSGMLSMKLDGTIRPLEQNP